MQGHGHLSSPSLADPTAFPFQEIPTPTFSVGQLRTPTVILGTSLFYYSPHSSPATSDRSTCPRHPESEHHPLFSLLHPGPYQHHLLPGLLSLSPTWSPRFQPYCLELLSIAFRMIILKRTSSGSCLCSRLTSDFPSHAEWNGWPRATRVYITWLSSSFCDLIAYHSLPCFRCTVTSLLLLCVCDNHTPVSGPLHMLFLLFEQISSGTHLIFSWAHYWNGIT